MERVGGLASRQDIGCRESMSVANRIGDSIMWETQQLATLLDEQKKSESEQRCASCHA